AVFQSHSCDACHQIHLGRPGVPERKSAERARPVWRHRDVVGRELLCDDVVLVESDVAPCGAGLHRERDGVLSGRQASQVRQTHLDEDIIMFAALSELAAGYNDETVTWLYRIHEQQTHKTDTSRLHSQTGRTIALQRIQALTRDGIKDNGQPTPVRNFEVQAGEAAKYNVAPGTTWWK